MPKIMIKGMKMPKSCRKCPFTAYIQPEDYRCVITDQNVFFVKKDERDLICPLCEVNESEDMKLAWLPEGEDKRYCLFLIKDDGVKIKIKDPKYMENNKTCTNCIHYKVDEINTVDKSNPRGICYALPVTTVVRHREMPCIYYKEKVEVKE